ncbi:MULTISPECIES: hypothetical protein [Streptomyces]|nr:MULTISPECIES: hypothetical protein [Streptomyces]WSI60591.1 hypothetical protein OG471_00045 [Streptomyces sp. NBC_01336]WSI68077.1 hypothetical protein OG471_41315 [Streptomyces sp. NBC_01336]
MPEIDDSTDETQPELVVRKVDGAQDDDTNPHAETPDQTPGPEISTRSNSMMTQGQM